MCPAVCAKVSDIYTGIFISSEKEKSGDDHIKRLEVSRRRYFYNVTRGPSEGKNVFVDSYLEILLSRFFYYRK